jgi:hypothetical protein
MKHEPDRPWPAAADVHVRCHVGDRGQSGLVMLKVNFVESDPKRTLGLAG